MAFWHMQLHSNDPKWNREEELLEKLSLIGIGDDWEGGESQINNFIKDMQIGDIVLVRLGNTPKALVEIIGEVEDVGINDYGRLDWFRYRRKIKVLDWANENMDNFPQPRGTLQRLIDTKTKSYQYIENWHKKISPSFYRKQKGLKLNKIYIQKYKIFNEFNLTFNEEITVLAGINGSGKTTLLEYINDFTDFILDKDDDRSLIDFEMDNQNKTLSYSSSFENIGKEKVKEISLEAKYFNNHIKYFPTGTDIKDLKVLILDYVKRTMHNEDLKPSEVFDKIRDNIDSIFAELNMLIEFDKVDENDEVYFKNKNNESFTIDNLSTGEKTLLAKVLYLYLKEIKDSVILIDEPELSLHPSWQNRVLKLYENFAKENNCQIIIATHSPHIIGSAKPGYLRILTLDEEKNVKVLDNFTKSYGLEFEKILVDIMGIKNLRVPEVDEKIRSLKESIKSKDSELFRKLFDEMIKVLGFDDTDLQLIKIQAKLKGLDVSGE